MILIDYPKNGYCHLVADDINYLHKFASKVGIKRCWFHNKRGKKKPHYDIKEKLMYSCIKQGAIQVDSKIIVEFLKEHYG